MELIYQRLVLLLPHRVAAQAGHVHYPSTFKEKEG